VIAGLLILLTIVSFDVEDTVSDLEPQVVSLTEKIEERVTELTLEIQEKEDRLFNKKLELSILQKNLTEIPTDSELIEERKKTEREHENLRLEINDLAPTPERLSKLKELDNRIDELFSLIQKGEEFRRNPIIDQIHIVNSTIIFLSDEIEGMKQSRTSFVSRSFADLQELRSIIKKAIEKDEKDEEESLLKTPEDWVYFIGTPIAFSAVIAATISYFDENLIRSSRALKGLLFVSIGSMAAGFIYSIWIFLKIAQVL